MEEQPKASSGQDKPSTPRVYQERINRWHDKRIELLSFCISLIFTINLALLGFAYSNDLTDNSPLRICFRISIYASLLFGFFALTSRMFDFKLTHNITKHRKRYYQIKNSIIIIAEAKSALKTLDNRIYCLSCTTKCLGKLTKAFFLIEAITFIAAVILYIYIIETSPRL